MNLTRLKLITCGERCYKADKRALIANNRDGITIQRKGDTQLARESDPRLAHTPRKSQNTPRSRETERNADSREPPWEENPHRLVRGKPTGVSRTASINSRALQL